MLTSGPRALSWPLQPRLASVRLCELSSCSAAALLACWLRCVSSRSASRRLRCRLGRLPDSCSGAALRLLFSEKPVSSYTSAHSTLPPPHLSLPPSLSPMSAPVHARPLSHYTLECFFLLSFKELWGVEDSLGFLSSSDE